MEKGGENAGWHWSVYILIWTVVNSLPMWIVIATRKSFSPDEEQKKNPRFRAFFRKD